MSRFIFLLLGLWIAVLGVIEVRGDELVLVKPAENIRPDRPTPLLELEWIRLESYRPTYFLMGKPDAKIQLSLKTQAIRGINLYFGYTQLVFWNLFKYSSPIRDVNYNPEMFYRTFSDDKKTFFDLGFYEHESNGKDGSGSRSWDRTYVRIYRNHVWGERRALGWSFKFFLPYNFDPQNRKIADYRGLWEAQLMLTQYLSFLFDIDEVILRFYPGDKFNPLKGGRELTFRGKASVKKVSVPLVFQIFQGTGEGLLDFKEKRWGIRLGFGF